jgi:hypothetical protein
MGDPHLISASEMLPAWAERDRKRTKGQKFARLPTFRKQVENI